MRDLTNNVAPLLIDWIRLAQSLIQLGDFVLPTHDFSFVPKVTPHGILLLTITAAASLLWITFAEVTIPNDAKSFENFLKEHGPGKPGPLGYFNSIYMAFTREEAENFPNLVSVHTRMKRIKTQNSTIPDKYVILGIQAPNDTQEQNSTRNKRDSESYRDTTQSGTCSATIGGLQRLCEVCPARTDLGPDITPRFINEVLCDVPGLDCGVGQVGGKCRSASVFQDFLRFSSSDSNLEVYSQEIRVCCECALALSWVMSK